jgi:hypothetical protein
MSTKIHISRPEFHGEHRDILFSPQKQHGEFARIQGLDLKQDKLAELHSTVINGLRKGSTRR